MLVVHVEVVSQRYPTGVKFATYAKTLSAVRSVPVGCRLTVSLMDLSFVSRDK